MNPAAAAGYPTRSLESLSSYRHIALLTEGYSAPFYAKTAIRPPRYRRDVYVHGPAVLADAVQRFRPERRR